MKRSLVLVVAVLTALAVVVPAAADQPDDPGANGRARAAQAHAELVAYWTPARLKAAQPRDVAPPPMAMKPPEGKGPGGGKGGGGGDDGGDGGSTVVTGAAWASPDDTAGSVYATVGKLFFSLPSGNFQCSASLVNEAGAREAVVATAAHCVNEGGNGSTDGAWATNISFIPDFEADGYGVDCDARAYGCWAGVAVRATAEYVEDARDLSSDVAFVRLAEGGNAGFFGDVTDAVGASHGIDFSGVTAAEVDAVGYPAGTPYPGDDLSYCAGPLTSDPYGQPTVGVACDMTGGSSGGPWLRDLADDGSDEVGVLVSVTSYGYTRGRYAGKFLYGSVLGAQEEALYDAVLNFDIDDPEAVPNAKG